MFLKNLKKKGAAEWYWVIIGMVIILFVAIFIFALFTESGAGIKESLGGLLDLAKKVPSP
jgi:hypothetical protein